MSLISLIFGDANEKTIKALKPIITKINGYEEALKNLSDESLRAKTEEFRAQLGLTMVDGEFVHQHRKAEEAKILDRLLPEAFAVVREASRRVLGQRHYDVQLIGGITLHHGQIAEMKTGEGKTLVETLPLYLNALAGHGVHLITVNDYLSRVGAGWMAPVYHSLGLSTSVIIHEQAFKYDPEYNDDTQFDERLRHFKLIKRQEAYNCDITYGTNNEFGFDYLRDNMAASLSERVQRDLHYAVVDEVDSILIDEARTPLIISGAVDESTDKYYKFTELVSRLVENDDYNVDEKMRTASLTEAGITKMEQWLGVDNIYVTGGIKEVHHIEQALKARVLFHKDKDYVVKDGEVIIVDEFTGRMMQGRRYSEGLHQAIEAKENVQIQRESQTMATVTFQNYFRMYFKLSGMTGTAMTEAEEFYKIYNLDTIAIPTNKPVKRQDLNDLIYATEAGKYQAIVNEIKSRHEKGQPVLVGTISIERNEHLAHLLELEGIPHQVLNAKQHDREALTISQAGKVGGVTIATNMAGRGVDIILGGDPFNQAEHDKVIELGGLHVIGTERHESRRIDNQLRGRAGRQGDPGSSQFYVSMEDDLMRIFGGDRMKNIMQTMKLPADMPIDNRIITKSIESAQKKVEGNNFDTRKHLVEYDDVINKHRETIYERRLRILRLAENKINSEDSSNYQSLTDIILEMVDQEITDVVTFHTSSDELGEWNIKEISDTIATIYPTEPDLQASLQAMLSGDNSKLDRVKIRTKVIDYLFDLAKQKYQDLVEVVSSANVPWSEIEKNILLRSMDLLWIEHLEAMDYMRRGIGLRGYGQRDPLVEYKKEAFRMYSELNSLIQKQTVYSIYKLGGVTQAVESDSLAKKGVIYSAPAKEMTKGSSAFSEGDGGTGPTLKMALNEPKQKAKDESGHKVGRNDPCPCGATKNDGTPIKYKNCHGKA